MPSKDDLPGGSVAEKLAATVDERRPTMADGLDTAASTLRGKAAALPGGERVSGFAETAADRLNNTADYVREHDVRRMTTDVGSIVKNNPGPSLIVAAVFGFLIGRAIARD